MITYLLTSDNHQLGEISDLLRQAKDAGAPTTAWVAENDDAEIFVQWDNE